MLDQFGVDPNEVAQIVVTRPFPGESEYVTIDFNAEHVDSVWAEGSSVTIAGTPYEENSPAAGVFESTPCKGDLLNDDLCDFYDIDALIEAFGDGETYNANDPGLAGSRTWHGDLNCDSVVDFYDIDGFVARLGDCTSECYEGDNLQGGGEGPQMQMMGGGAAAIAAQLAASVSAENMPALIVAVEQLALNPPANSTTDWSAVLAALAGV